MIKLAQERDIQVVLIAVPNTNLLLTPIEEYQKVADKNNVPLLNNLLSDVLAQPSLHSDIIHPNAKGYQQMALGIYDFLQDNGAID